MKAAKINMIMANATTIGHRMENIMSIKVLMFRVDTWFGWLPGSNPASAANGMAISKAVAETAMIFLVFMVCVYV